MTGSVDQSGTIDPFYIRKLHEPLRVVDASEALDGIGYFELGKLDEQIRPPWLGMRFWGVAQTTRCIPANKSKRPVLVADRRARGRRQAELGCNRMKPSIPRRWKKPALIQGREADSGV